MEIRWLAAAGGTALLHGVMIASALSIAGPQAARPHAPPIAVALLRPPEPPPRPEIVKPPEPLPPTRRAPKPPPAERRAAPPAAPAPAPVPAVAVARQIDEPRPSAIAALPAPPSSPVAPRVTDGAPPTTVAAAPARETPAAPVRVGPRFDASWSGNAPPPYPAMARRMGEEGEVRLDVQVGQDGTVLDVRLKKSSGSQLLDQTAIETVKKWRFTPATVDGKPVAEWYYNWKWVFRLES